MALSGEIAIGVSCCDTVALGINSLLGKGLACCGVEEGCCDSTGLDGIKILSTG